MLFHLVWSGRDKQAPDIKKFTYNLKLQKTSGSFDYFFFYLFYYE